MFRLIHVAILKVNAKCSTTPLKQS